MASDYAAAILVVGKVQREQFVDRGQILDDWKHMFRDHWLKASPGAGWI
jgi:hypothetical protein